MRSAIIPRHHITLSLYHSPHAGVPPVFIDVPSPPASLVFEGSNITYHCTAKGSSPPRIIWLHENTYIQSVLHQDGENTTSIVNLPKVWGGDSGVYSCIAISELQGSVVGVNEARASLTVIGECALHLNGSADLPCQASAQVLYYNLLHFLSSSFAYLPHLLTPHPFPLPLPPPSPPTGGSS